MSEAIAKLKQSIKLSATGNYRGEIMRVTTDISAETPHSLLWICGLFTAVLGVAAVCVKSIFDAEAQIMGVSSVENKGAYLSLYGYCMQRKKRDPKRDDKFTILTDVKYTNLGILTRKLIDTYNTYSNTVPFQRDFYFINKPDGDLMKQMIVWIAANNIHLSDLMSFFPPHDKNFIDVEYLLDLYMLPLDILKKAGYDITKLNFYEDLKCLCQIMYHTKKITQGNLELLQKKHNMKFVEV